MIEEVIIQCFNVKNVRGYHMHRGYPIMCYKLVIYVISNINTTYTYYLLHLSISGYYLSSSTNSECESVIKLSCGNSSPLVRNARDGETKPKFVALLVYRHA